MPVWIHQVETILPEFSFSQEQASQKMQDWFKDDRTRRIIRVLYRQSGIEKRHSVITNFDGNEAGSFFKTGPDALLQGPGTAARNDIFALESRSLSVALARKVLDRCPGVGPMEITHVVTASCTGFYNPGPDFYIVCDLGMPFSTQRYHLGFMGCYAAFPALRMAAQFCQADPDAVVLVMCLELCSLHLQMNGNEDSLLANSLFADGAGAAIVSARPPKAPIGSTTSNPLSFPAARRTWPGASGITDSTSPCPPMFRRSSAPISESSSSLPWQGSVFAGPM